MVAPVPNRSSDFPKRNAGSAGQRESTSETSDNSEIPVSTAEAELRAAIQAGNQQRAARVLEMAPYLRIHASKPRPIDQAIDYWRSVCAGVDYVPRA